MDLRKMPAEGDLDLIELKKKIPSCSQFYIYEVISPILMMIQEQFEFLSMENQPTSCLVMPVLYRIKSTIDKVKPYLTITLYFPIHFCCKYKFKITE